MNALTLPSEAEASHKHELLTGLSPEQVLEQRAQCAF